MVGQGEGQFKGRRVRPMGTKRGTKRQFEGPVVQRGRKAEAAGLGAQGQNEVDVEKKSYGGKQSSLSVSSAKLIC